MKVTSDPRAARTRDAIVTAMHELMDLSDATLTVSSLVSRAGISRSSFYAQFASIDELALEVLRDALAEIAAAGEIMRDEPEVTDLAAARADISRLVAHVDNNRVLCRSVLNMPVSYCEAVKILETVLRAFIPRVTRRDGRVGHDVTAAYVAGGAVAVLTGWLHDPGSRTREDVTDQLLALMPNWIADTPAEPTDDSF